MRVRATNTSGGGGGVYYGTTSTASPEEIDFGFVPKRIMFYAWGNQNNFVLGLYDADNTPSGKGTRIYVYNGGPVNDLYNIAPDSSGGYIGRIGSLSGTKMKINSYSGGSIYGNTYSIFASAN